MVNAANECSRLIIAHKERNLIRMSVKLEDPSTAPKTNWSILNMSHSCYQSLMKFTQVLNIIHQLI